jgi:hypothetical protein
MTLSLDGMIGSGLMTPETVKVLQFGLPKPRVQG